MENQPDRFIPQREELDLEMSNHLLSHKKSPNQKDTPPLYKNAFPQNKKILRFKKQAPNPKLQNETKILYSCPSKIKRKQTIRRNIALKPELTLEAPQLEDDFYLNVLDWSCNNILAIALKNEIYLWNGNSGNIEQIQVFNSNSSVSSLRWSSDGSHLAVGTNENTTLLYDTTKLQLVRTLHGHLGRIACLSWNKYVLSSGSKDTTILNHDVRARQHVLSSFQYHTSEVCGIQWCPRGETLASGGNDNIVSLWDVRTIQQQYVSNPKFSLCSHQAAVKALSWAPFQNNLLATGGGTGDRKIRFWNTQTGIELNSIDTGSQICSLQWSKNNSKEIISSHGYAKNQLVVWKYPCLKQVSGDLIGHTHRVLHMSLSPDGTTVATAAGDEKLCFWRVFEEKEDALRKKKRNQNSLISREIR